MLPAIKANPKAAATLLIKYLDLRIDAHPLRYMGVWLREQLAAKS